MELPSLFIRCWQEVEHSSHQAETIWAPGTWFAVTNLNCKSTGTRHEQPNRKRGRGDRSQDQPIDLRRCGRTAATATAPRDLTSSGLSPVPTRRIAPTRPQPSELARISHTIFARWGRMVRWQVGFWGDVLGRCVREDASGAWDFAGLRGAAKDWSRWAWDDAAVVSRCGGACQAGEPRALAAARRTAAQPQTSAAGQLDAIAILMRRTLTRTSAPILSSLRRMVPQLALANDV